MEDLEKRKDTIINASKGGAIVKIHKLIQPPIIGPRQMLLREDPTL